MSSRKGSQSRRPTSICGMASPPMPSRRKPYANQRVCQRGRQAALGALVQGQWGRAVLGW
eukprot:1292901-Prymnesium_polylepis.3